MLAVICDDRVTATVESSTGPHEPRHWREWEVELVSGGTELLDDLTELLRSSGARASEAESKLSRVLPPPANRMLPEQATASSVGALVLTRAAHLVDELVAWDMRYRLDQPDSVHRVRITARRLRSLLTTARPVLDREVVDGLRRDLRWLGQRLSTERDAQVLRHHLMEQAIPNLPGDIAPERHVTQLRAYLASRQRKGHRKASRAVSSRRYLSLLERLETFAAGEPAPGPARRPAAPELRRLLRRDGKRLRRAMKAADSQPPGTLRDEALHEVRKKAMRLRYAAELAEPVLGKPAKRLRRAGTDLQQVLGEHQDAVVAARVLREMSSELGASRLDFQLGRLYAAEHTRAHGSEQRLKPRWKTVAKRLHDLPKKV